MLDSTPRRACREAVISTVQRRIVIVSGQHVCHCPRVLKEADVLSAAGYDVEVLGGWFDDAMAEKDRRIMLTRNWAYTPVLCALPATLRGQWTRFNMRAQGRLARAAFQRMGIALPPLLGYATRTLLRAARSRNADLTICHNESGLWVGSQLLNRGQRVGVDFEDWYSEDLPAEDRKQRPIAWLKQLERRLLRDATYRVCTSQVMAAALAKAYECAAPDVIWNVFPWSDRNNLDGRRLDRRDPSIPSICWFSQTLGPGRGLEDLMASLTLLSIPVEVHLRGHSSAEYVAQLTEALPPDIRARVFIHPVVPPNELLSRIAEHDIGFAGELTYCENKRLTISNKLFQYWLAGIAVVASDTLGQREALEQAPDAGVTYEAGSPSALAMALDRLLADRAALEHAKASALRAAENTFCIEMQAPRLAAFAARAFESALAT